MSLAEVNSQASPLPDANRTGWRPASRLASWLAPLLLVPLVVFQLGYVYGGASYTLLFPAILRRIDPSLLARDWFANVPPDHVNFVRFLAWVARIAPLPPVVLVLHVLSLFVLLWTARRISGRLFEDGRVFYVALFLFLRWGTDGLGGNGLWGDYLLPHTLAAPVCLVAFYLALLERPLAAGLVAAAATWIHIQLGALTMLVLGLWMLLRVRRIGWRSIFLTGTVYLAAVAPTVMAQWAVFMAGPSPLSTREFLYLYAVLRRPHHLIPSSWPGAEYYRFFLLAGIALLGLVWEPEAWKQPKHRTIATWCAIILALGVVGYVFVELAPVKLIVKMQLFRMTIFVKFFVILYVARLLLQILEKERWPQKACALAILAIQNFAVIGVCAALIFALRQNRQWLWGLGLFAAGCVAGISMVATASLGIPIPMFFHSFAVVPRGVWVGLVSLAVLAAVGWRSVRLIPGALIALAITLRYVTGLPFFGFDGPPADEWYRFCRQIKDTTPREAVFINPPSLGGFQMFAERAEIADYKNAPSTERDAIEWKRRLDDLAGAELLCTGWVQCGSILAGGYYKLREHEFLQLARKYGAQYVITAEPRQRLSFPELFRSGEFALYQVPP